MLSTFARRWWAVALQGLAAVIFGILALVWPRPTLVALVLVFGAFVLADGIFALVQAIAWRKLIRRWWAVALAGVAGMIVGVLTFIWPGATGLVLLSFVAAWAMITGILEIVAAVELRRLIEGEWLMVVNGILSVVFGVLVVLFPGAGALGVAWMIGAYALISGILLIVLAFRMHSWLHDVHRDIKRAFEGLA
jgi:uncharacterized membrane protein HdeD (DUF308 family)